MSTASLIGAAAVGAGVGDPARHELRHGSELLHCYSSEDDSSELHDLLGETTPSHTNA